MSNTIQIKYFQLYQDTLRKTNYRNITDKVNAKTTIICHSENDAAIVAKEHESYYYPALERKPYLTMDKAERVFAVPK